MRTDDNMLPPEVERELDAIDAALAGRPVEPELSELGRLALELRAERPEIDPFFGRELDAKVQAGFPRPARGSRLSALAARLRANSMLVPGVAASMLLALVVSVALIGAPQGDDESAGGSGEVAAPAADSDTALGTGTGATGAAEGGSGAGGGDEGGRAAPAPTATARPRHLAPATGAATLDEAQSLPYSGPGPGGGSPRSDRRSARKVEHSASLTLVAKPERIDHVADGIVRVTDALGGFVVTSTVSSTDGEGGGGVFELRVPSSRLQQALSELSKLAHVRARQQSATDITAEGVSARDRLQDARAERRSLLRQLSRATTTAQMETLKARLRDVAARISAAKTDLARVNNRASFSNISVSLASDPEASEGSDDEGTWTPGDAFNDAIRILEVLAGVALVSLAIGLPLALLAALLVIGARAAGRRRRERALDAV